MSQPTAFASVTRTLDAITHLTGLPEGCILQQEGSAIALRRGEVLLQSIPAPAHPLAIAQLLVQASAPAATSLHGGWMFDATARQLTREADAHALTEKETLLLGQLVAAYPAPCTRDALLRDVWSMQPDIETHTLETHIYRLRHKLAELSPKPCDIVTEDGAYVLTLEPTA